jgi:dTDP-4-dehydrorhamnose 3,5-epimerase
MEIWPQAIADVLVLQPARFGDARGYFSEIYSQRTLKAHGIEFDFVQDNFLLSANPGTVRGLHFQGSPSTQTKLVSVLRGAILDVAVDIRKGSPHFGKHVAVELSAENGLQILVPRGFAHGICTLVPDTMVLYKVDAFYDSQRDYGLLWNDPALGIGWPEVAASPCLSDKDKVQPRLAELPRHFTYGEVIS